MSEDKHLCLLIRINTTTTSWNQVSYFLYVTRGAKTKVILTCSYLFLLMIQVSVSNRVFTEPTELIHIYFGLTDGVAFKPFFIFWAISILFLFIPCICL